MKLIRRLGMRESKTGNSSQSCGLFLCSYCGKEVEKQLSHGKRDQSCGCSTYKILSTQNGHSSTRLYNTWRNMKLRCLDINNKYYGKKGISVCKEWLEFMVFRAWAIENGYKKDLQIDRRNNNKSYSPKNCRWISKAENIRNSTVTKLTKQQVRVIRFLYEAGQFNNSVLADIFGISKAQISDITKYKSWRNV